MIKNYAPIGLVTIGMSIFMSCSGPQQSNTKSIAKDTVKQCYISDFEGDTAILNLSITDTVKVEGTLLIRYANQPHNTGTIRGEFKGDTLYVDYSFKIGNNSVQFSNPLAFLKKDSTLTMGVGQIETAYGRSYFVKEKPINYERGKFTFLPKSCQ